MKKQTKQKIKNYSLKTLHIIGYISIFIVVLMSILLGVTQCNKKDDHINNDVAIPLNKNPSQLNIGGAHYNLDSDNRISFAEYDLYYIDLDSYIDSYAYFGDNRSTFQITNSGTDVLFMDIYVINSSGTLNSYHREVRGFEYNNSTRTLKFLGSNLATNFQAQKGSGTYLVRFSDVCTFANDNKYLAYVLFNSIFTYIENSDSAITLDYFYLKVQQFNDNYIIRSNTSFRMPFVCSPSYLNAFYFNYSRYLALCFYSSNDSVGVLRNIIPNTNYSQYTQALSVDSFTFDVGGVLLEDSLIICDAVNNGGFGDYVVTTCSIASDEDDFFYTSTNIHKNSFIYKYYLGYAFYVDNQNNQNVFIDLDITSSFLGYNLMTSDVTNYYKRTLSNAVLVYNGSSYSEMGIVRFVNPTNLDGYHFTLNQWFSNRYPVNLGDNGVPAVKVGEQVDYNGITQDYPLGVGAQVHYYRVNYYEFFRLVYYSDVPIKLNYLPSFNFYNELRGVATDDEVVSVTDVLSLIRNAFDGLGGIFSLELIAGISIGALFFMPLVVGVLLAVIRLFKR